MTLRVLEPGLSTRVVDLGRPQCRSLGVPVGGAADRASLILGNALLGNPPNAAALEVTLAGPALEADCDLACVVYGAPFALSSERQSLLVGRTFTLQSGERLRIGGTREGARAYFCVGGGLQVKTVLGSRSGLTALAAGAELPCEPGRIGHRSTWFPGVWTSRPTDLPEYLGTWKLLRVIDGAQAGWFSSHGFLKPADDEVPLLPPRFIVSAASDRMGLRLQGSPLAVPECELVSEPVCPGSVQVTGDGQCIVLGVDGQTIGGYPKIAQVIAADLDLLGQLRPGEQVCFVRVTLAEAESLYRWKQEQLGTLLRRLRIATGG